MPHPAGPARRTALAPRVAVREAARRDRPTIRAVVAAAFAGHAAVLPPAVFARYLADLLDLDRHAASGTLIVAELDGDIVGSVVFCPDISRQGAGWPPGWAGGRALAVHPAARRSGAARALLGFGEQVAGAAGAPAVGFHTAAVMRDAVAVYRRLGYRRAPRHDVDLAAHYGLPEAGPLPSLAFHRPLARRPCVRR